jgi:bisphosphoglycerate-dependent phosphoglycerate mutase
MTCFLRAASVTPSLNLLSQSVLRWRNEVLVMAVQRRDRVLIFSQGDSIRGRFMVNNYLRNEDQLLSR